MKHSFKEMILQNHRAFYATLVCLLTVIIDLIYYVFYNKSPLSIVATLPIIFWIAYDGNEHEKATVEGYWVWVALLIISSILVIMFPLF